MVMPKDSFQMTAQEKILEGWRDQIKSLEESLEILERGIDEVVDMVDICTPDWCVATEHVMDELNNRISSISEPYWSSDEDSKKLKDLKKRLHDAYGKYRVITTR